MEFGDHSLPEGDAKGKEAGPEHGIYVQDLSRMKAMLYNNIATSYFHMGNI